MAIRPVRLRALAAIAIDHAADYSLGEAGVVAARRVIEAVERTFGQIGRSPRAGSLR